MEAFFEQLRHRLQAAPPKTLSLPGVALREAAVLVPLFVRGELQVLFTKRPESLRMHGGQISFPGGAREEGDLTPLHTALRETREELGIPPEQVEVLGMLDEIPTITQFRVAPFVGVIPPQVAYVPNPDEIDQIIEVPLSHLLDPAFQRSERWEVSGRQRDVYFYDYGQHVIWGATARILRDLLHVIAELVPQRGAQQ